MPEEKKINLGIEDGKDFFAHEMSVNFNPTQFILDFRCITPRVDPRSREMPFVSMKHNVIMVEPWHAKEILRVLTNVINKYEGEFGEIEKPKAVQEFEKKKAQNTKIEPEKTQTPSYFG